MAQKNKADLQAESTSLFPTNDNQEISAARKRSFDTDMIDSSLNLAEQDNQSIAGPVYFEGGILGSGDNYKLINSMDGWPAPTFVQSLGRSARVLEPATTYIITAPLDFGAVGFFCETPADVVVRCVSRYFQHTYSGVDDFFVANDSIALEFLNMIYTGSGTPFLIKMSASQSNQALVLQNGFAVNWPNLTSSEGVFVTSFRLYTASGSSNVEFVGSSNTDFNASDCKFNNYSGSMLNFGGTVDMSDINLTSNSFSTVDVTSSAISMATNTLSSDGACIISGNNFNGSGNAISGPIDGANGSVNISSNTFVNGGSALVGGITTKDLRVRSFGNSALRDSNSIGSMFYDDFENQTTISTTLTNDEPVVIKADMIEGDNIERWEVIQNPVDSDSEAFALRCIDPEGFEGSIVVNLFGEESGAGSPDLQLAVFKNAPAQNDPDVFEDIVLPSGFAEPSGNAANITVIAPITAVSGDYFDFRIIRRSGGNTWQTRTISITAE